ncbi:16S rRNA (guanine(527)-N(7))-methyltransferase RsmG [uncultured Paracoccus sp.]|uniref:16S rRNA (guanine(527)-N(7))-methyltransferase RsmG n=1 Tax=uncultured Paracoccus sp. TaxID=189685 RepID=UPI00262E8984|nr:16S rRNA (guanine(527)-N(7))-methyltransferase RsmG [uncultured Paracoccus sp.]
MIASREAQLRCYAALVKKWSPSINLVAASTLTDLWDRHILDSAQLADVAPEAPSWLDLGSGGGLPGLVLAILRPTMSVELLEADARKCAFLRTCSRELDLPNVRVTNMRIEQRIPATAEHISARALAPLERLVPYVARHLAPHGTAWLMKGEAWQNEVDSVRNDWRFTLNVHPSRTRPGAAILQLSDIRHA